MRRLLLGVSLIFMIGNFIFGAEIIPETYLMERLLIPLENSNTYINNINGEEYKAVQIDNEVMKLIKVDENPFYVYDSTEGKKLVRKGDYFIAPIRLSGVYVSEKESFEKSYRNINLPEKLLHTELESNEIERINPEEVDSGNIDIKEES